MNGTSVVCNECGHVRETTETFPTLVACRDCGSYDVTYQTEVEA